MRIAVAWADPVTSATSPPRIANITGVIIFGVAPVRPQSCRYHAAEWMDRRADGRAGWRIAADAKRRLLFCDSDPGRAQTNRRDAG